MADNVTVSNGVLDAYEVLSDDVGGKHAQIVKLSLSADGVGAPVTDALPVSSASFTIRVDEGATYMYVGEATPGTATSTASWRIKRIQLDPGHVLFADGDSQFNNVWDDRASLTYL